MRDGKCTAQDVQETDSASIQERTDESKTVPEESVCEESVCEKSLHASCASAEEDPLPENKADGAPNAEKEAPNAEDGAQSAEESGQKGDAEGEYPVFPLDEEEEAYYEKRAEEDMREVARLFPELSPDGVTLTLGELRNPARFAELREAGLSVEEAFLASNYRMLSERPRGSGEASNARTDVRTAHTSLPRAIGRAVSMPTSLLLRSRTLFEGLSDTELASLYRRVTRA